MQGRNFFSSDKVYPLVFLAVFWGLLLLPPAIDLNTEGAFFGSQVLTGLFTDFRLAAGDRIFPQVLVGKDGWLFYTAEKNMDYYQNALDPELVAQSGESLIKLNGDLKKQGIQLLVVIAPDKESIYPQYLPDQLPMVGETSGLDDLISFLDSKHAGDFLLDLRPVLAQASASQQVYFRTDTHWNELGAYLAYREIITRLQRDFPVLQPIPLERYRYESLGLQRRDLTNILGASSPGEEVFTLKPDFTPQAQSSMLVLADGRKLNLFSNPDARLPRLLVYHDSFFRPLLPFIGEQFSRALAVPQAQDGDLYTWLNYEKPDIVIFEVVERSLLKIPAYLGDTPAR